MKKVTEALEKLREYPGNDRLYWDAKAEVDLAKVAFQGMSDINDTYEIIGNKAIKDTIRHRALTSQATIISTGFFLWAVLFRLKINVYPNSWLFGADIAAAVIFTVCLLGHGILYWNFARLKSKKNQALLAPLPRMDYTFMLGENHEKH